MIHMPPYKPLISLIIPVYNDQAGLNQTLSAILKQQFQDFEVIIVDDGSNKKINLEINDPRVKIIRIDHSGPAIARNVGVKISTSEKIAFIDAGCIPEKNWLDELVKNLDCLNIDGVCGKTQFFSKPTKFSDLVENIFGAIFVWFAVKDGQVIWASSTNLALCRKTFDDIGGFDKTFKLAAGEDIDLGLRMYSAGYNIKFLPSAVVYHPLDTFVKLCRRMFKYGRGNVRLSTKYCDSCLLIPLSWINYYLLILFLVVGPLAIALNFWFKWAFATLSLSITLIFNGFPYGVYYSKKYGISHLMYSYPLYSTVTDLSYIFGRLVEAIRKPIYLFKVLDETFHQLKTPVIEKIKYIVQSFAIVLIALRVSDVSNSIKFLILYLMLIACLGFYEYKSIVR